MSRYFDDTTVQGTIHCKRCGEYTHKTSDCTKDVLELSKCLLCAQTGHLVSDCPQKLSAGVKRNSLKDNNCVGAICIVCGEYDHINCKFQVQRELLPIETCPRCGEEGHEKLRCARGRKPATRASWGGDEPSEYEVNTPKIFNRFKRRNEDFRYAETVDKNSDKRHQRRSTGSSSVHTRNKNTNSSSASRKFRGKPNGY
jgi:hypothetical protein